MRRVDSTKFAVRYSSRRVASALAAAATLAAVFVAPTAAQAAAWNNISGQTWSDASLWYLSGTDRYKSGAGYIKGNMDRLPTFRSGAVDGLLFQATNRQGGCLPNSCVSFMFVTAGVDRTITAASIPGGTVFRNAFKRRTTCQSGCNHNFSGKEYY